MKRLLVTSLVFGWAALAGCSDDAGPGAVMDSEGADTTASDTVADSAQDSVVADTDVAADSADPDAVDTVSATDTTVAEPTNLYDEDRLIQVEITMAPADLEVMRTQARSIFDIVGPGCLEHPPVRPFTWFPATAVIDGYEVENVGVRKKGFFGSLDPVRPSLKLKFDEYVDGQSLAGQSRMTLNNVRQDPTRFNTCLSYQVFRQAGVPTPRCNFAHVTLNGFDLGVYVHVESIKKPFLRRVFNDDDGDLYEGALSDFREGWDQTFDKKTNESDPDSGIFDRVRAAIAAPDETLLADLDAVIDLDGFFTFWAAEVLVAHWDGYAGNTNNYYVYHDLRDDRLRFIPWGPDATFRYAQGVGGGTVPVTAAVTEGALAARLFGHTEGRARYRVALTTLLTDVWDADALLATVMRWDALTISTRLPGTLEAATEAVAVQREFITGRRSDLFGVLQDEPSAPPTPRGSPCLVPVGNLSGTFETTWGTLAEPNIFMTGSGSMTLTDSDYDPQFNRFGSKIGTDPEEPGQATLQVAGRMTGADYLVFGVTLDENDVATGVTVPLDFVAAEAALFYLTPSFEGSLAGYIGGGTLSFETAGTADGTGVIGSFQGIVYGGE